MVNCTLFTLFPTLIHTYVIPQSCQGGIIGPWVVGVIVEHTGGYGVAMQLLGYVMCTAAAMAWGTRGWDLALQREAAASLSTSQRSSPLRGGDLDGGQGVPTGILSGGRGSVEMQGLLSLAPKDKADD